MNYLISHNYSFHPVFFCMIGIVSGIIGFYQGNYYLVGSVLGLSFGTVYSTIKQTNYRLTIFALTLGFFAGYLRTSLCDKNGIFAYENQPITFSCTVDGIEQTSHAFYQAAITCTITQLLQPKNSYNESKRIIIYTRNNHRLQVGDTVIIKNLICKTISAPGFALYLHKEGIQACAYTHNLSSELVFRPPINLMRTTHNIFLSLINTINQKLDKKTAALFGAIFLGEKQAKKKTEPIAADFKKWGIVHQLARSGLHLAILVGSWYTIARCIPAPFMVKQFLLLLLCIVYSFLSVGSISFIRSLNMFIVQKVLLFFRIPSNIFHILTLVCTATLLYNPLHLFFLDFQLTFLFTFGLIWSHPFLS